MGKKSKKIKTEKIDHVRMEEQFNNFQGLMHPMKEDPTLLLQRKLRQIQNKNGSDGLISNDNAFLVVVFLVIVLSHKDFFTAFGKGTGVSKAHISPLSITTYVSGNDQIEQKELPFSYSVQENDYQHGVRG